MKRLILLFVTIAINAIIGYAYASNMPVRTIIFDANSQPPIVGGVIDGYSDGVVLKRGVIVSSTLDNAEYKGNENWYDISWYFDLKDHRIIDCTDIGNEQFWCSLKLLESSCDYYVRAFVVMKNGTVSLGNVEKLRTKSFNRYRGNSDYANVWYAFSYTLFDLVTDEIVNPNDGFYYSTNENPKTVRYQKGTGYNTCYKYATEWNYKLWYYHNTNHCDKNKVVNMPIMTFSNGKLAIQKNPLDANKSITIYYCINGNYFRPETYTDIYSSPISVSSPCIVYCYAISSDGYISYTNMYVIDKEQEHDYSAKVADAVDLGLSSGTLWASWNIGASAPEEYGKYFAWGETAPKDNYTWITYKFGASNYTKYNSVDGLTQLELEDDAAYVIWGKNWRMPTHDQELELAKECSWESTQLNGVSGYKITGPNGNWIFMPRGGLYDGTDYGSEGEKLSYVNNGGWYWSSTLNSKGSSYAQGLCFFPSLIEDVVDHERCDGHNIRPVYVGDSSTGIEEKNHLVVRDVAVHQEQSIVIDVELENSTTDLTAYQFDLVLPNGFTLATDSKGQYQVTKADRYENKSQSLSASLLEDNAYRIVSYSLSNGKIVGTTGAIMNVVLSIADNVRSGTYKGSITNVFFTKSDGTLVKLSDVKFDIVVNRVLMGDVNGDKEVNVADIVEIVNDILGKTSSKFVRELADMNGDGEINVTDIVKVISIILSDDGNKVRIRNAGDEQIDADYLTLKENGDGSLSLCLENSGDYIASQFDIRLSDGQSLNGISLNDMRCGQHLLAYKEVERNLYKVMIYSLSNESYLGSQGELLNIRVSGCNNMEIENTLFVTAGLKEKRFSSLDAVTTGIDIDESDNEFEIYSIDGRLVNRQTSSINGLSKGVYIIKGKKHVVR